MDFGFVNLLFVIRLKLAETISANVYTILSPQQRAENEWDHNLAHDFSRTMCDTDYFASNILVVEFKLICPG
jgi:hypothetical protein